MIQWKSFDFTYGTVEFRAKMAGGQGTWSTVWLLGSNCQQTNGSESAGLTFEEQLDKRISRAIITWLWAHCLCFSSTSKGEPAVVSRAQRNIRRNAEVRVELDIFLARMELQICAKTGRVTKTEDNRPTSVSKGAVRLPDTAAEDEKRRVQRVGGA